MLDIKGCEVSMLVKIVIIVWVTFTVGFLFGGFWAVKDK